MWPKLLRDYFDEDESQLFLGIGSIIFDSHPASAKKLVMGAGYGGYTEMPKIDGSWDIRFVRGKMTAKAMGIDPGLGIGDSAILLRSVIDFSAPRAKKHKFSFMPHWESATVGGWELACKYAGMNYLDPCGSVEEVLEGILDSEAVITEAMHGAIVSDALRVPWVAVQPIHTRHRMKWMDWASALDIDFSPRQVPASSLLEAVVAQIGQKGYVSGKLQYHGQGLNAFFGGVFAKRAAAALLGISKSEPTLSGENNIRGAHEAMLEKVHELVG